MASTNLKAQGSSVLAPGEALHVVLVYQDALTREWAAQLWARVVQPLSAEKVLFKSWRISDLAHPEVLPEAVVATAEADILLVAIRDSEELPMQLSVWMEAWLPLRGNRPGALVPLIGIPGPLPGQGSQLDQRFRALADRGHLDYMARWFALPTPSRSELEREAIVDRAKSDTQMLRNIVTNPAGSSRRSREP